MGRADKVNLQEHEELAEEVRKYPCLYDKGNVQPLRNAQRWEGGNSFCYGALLEGDGGSSDTVT